MDKIISEQAVIDVIDRHLINRKAVIDRIKAIPSAEPSGDLISREAVDKLSKELVHTTRDKADFLCNFWEGLQKLSSVKSQERTGRWIYDDIANNWRCDKCGETPKTMGYVGTYKFMTEHFRFCNHCGTRMIEPQEGEKSEDYYRGAQEEY